MNTTKYEKVTIRTLPHSFPMAQLIEHGIWEALSPHARAVLGVLWHRHQLHPDACHPSRRTIASLAGVSAPTVTRSIQDLEDIGLLKVISSPGPRPNTYQLNWAELTVLKSTNASTNSSSPYKPPETRKNIGLYVDEKGRPQVRRTRANHTYKMADGCVLRSAGEMLIHDALLGWKVPHWSDVPYSVLGIKVPQSGTRKSNHQHTVDFVVAPNLLIEKVGLAGTQNGAINYRRKLDAKISAAEQAGWDVFKVMPGEVPDDDLHEAILNAWASATIEDARRLWASLKIWNSNVEQHPSKRGLSKLIRDADKRLSGESPPKPWPVLFEQRTPEGGGPPAYYRLDAELVLMAGAGEKHEDDTDTASLDYDAFLDSVLDAGP